MGLFDRQACKGTAQHLLTVYYVRWKPLGCCMHENLSPSLG